MSTLFLDNILSIHFSDNETYTETILPNDPPFQYDSDCSSSVFTALQSELGSTSCSSSNPNHSIHIAFTDVFNTCDMREISNMFNTLCAPNLSVSYHYLGLQNPYGANRLDLFGFQAILEFWEKLFHTIPDGLFNLKNDTVLRSYSNGVDVVSSDFEYVGTKVYAMNIEKSQVAIYSNENEILDETNENDENFSDDKVEILKDDMDSQLSSILHLQKKTKIDNSSLSSENQNYEDSIQNDTFSDISSITYNHSEWGSSGYKSKDLLIFEFQEGRKIIDPSKGIEIKLLEKSSPMCAKGKMVIFINKEGFIYSIQFHHTVMF